MSSQNDRSNEEFPKRTEYHDSLEDNNSEENLSEYEPKKKHSKLVIALTIILPIAIIAEIFVVLYFMGELSNTNPVEVSHSSVTRKSNEYINNDNGKVITKSQANKSSESSSSSNKTQTGMPITLVSSNKIKAMSNIIATAMENNAGAQWQSIFKANGSIFISKSKFQGDDMYSVHSDTDDNDVNFTIENDSKGNTYVVYFDSTNSESAKVNINKVQNPDSALKDNISNLMQRPYVFVK